MAGRDKLVNFFLEIIDLTNVSTGVLHVPQLLHQQLQLLLRTLRESQEENFLEAFRIHLAGVAELVDDFIVVITDNLQTLNYSK